MSYKTNVDIDAVNVIKKKIGQYKLNLSKAIVLTEIGSGAYSYNPIIAAMAGAKVYAVKNKYVTKKDINLIKSIASNLGLTDKIILLNSKNNIPNKKIDIITNSLALRPLDSEFLKRFSKPLVIPLMYESWELRDVDIDINYCRQNNIAIIGTNENYGKDKIFDLTGELACKMITDMKARIKTSNILVYSRDLYRTAIQSSLKKNGAKKIITVDNLYKLKKIDFGNIDVIFFADHHNNKILVGEKEIIKPSILKKQNPKIIVIELYKVACHSDLNKYRVKYYPIGEINFKTMSKTLDYCDPLIWLVLYIKSLRAAQIVYNSLSHGSNKAEKTAFQYGIGQLVERL